MSTLRPNLSGAAPLHELLSARAPSHRSLASQVQRIFDLMLVWHQRARQRRELQCLSDRMLRDIGLTRADVLAESSKPFWRL